MFWIHVEGLSVECFAKEMVSKIAERMAGTSQIEIRGDPKLSVWLMYIILYEEGFD